MLFFDEDIDTVFQGDNDIITTVLSNLLVKDAHQLLIVPQTKFDNQCNHVLAIKQLQALSTSAIKGPLTEATAVQMDAEITLGAKDLEALIDRKVDEKTRELKQLLKNLSRGATSSA